MGGRKLEFNKQRALEAAMHVFWSKGYLGASLSELVDTMGINKPSLYATFGNKEALFLQATEHYLSHIATAYSRLLEEPGLNLKERLTNYLQAVVEGQCEETTPKGCYISLCLSEAASNGMPQEAKSMIHNACHHTLNTLTAILQNDPEAKKHKLNEQAEQNALTLVTMLHGTAAMARAGKTKEDLKPVIQRTLDSILTDGHP